MKPRSRHLICPLTIFALAASAFAQDAATPAPSTEAFLSPGANPPSSTTAAGPAAAPTAPAESTTVAASIPTTSVAPIDELKQDKFTDSVAAVVNGQIITLDELHKAIEPDVNAIYEQIKAQYRDDDPQKETEIFTQQVNALGTQRLKDMVDRLLIIQEFKDKGFKVPAAYLDRQFEDSMTTDFQDDRVAFLKKLAEDGISELDYRQRLEENDEIGYLVDQQHSSATGLSPDRIKAYYEKHKEDYHEQASVKVRQIVLAPVADSPVAEQAAKIVQEARLPGANFLELAQKYSSDPLARAGNLPDQTFTSESKLPPEVQQAVFSLAPGDVSDPVTTHDPKTNQSVIFIFKCDEKNAEGYLPLELDKVRLDIEGKLSKEDEDQATEKWLAGLRSKAYIKYNLSDGQ